MRYDFVPCGTFVTRCVLRDILRSTITIIFGTFSFNVIEAHHEHKLTVVGHHASLRSSRGAPRAKSSKPVPSVKNGWVAGHRVYDSPRLSKLPSRTHTRTRTRGRALYFSFFSPSTCHGRIVREEFASLSTTTTRRRAHTHVTKWYVAAEILPPNTMHHGARWKKNDARI